MDKDLGMRLKNYFTATVVATACAVSLSACSSPFSRTSSVTPTNSVSGTPTTSQSPSGSAIPSPSVETTTYSMYYFADTQQGLRLYREWHKVSEVKPVDLGLSALQRLVDSGEVPVDADYKTAWSPGSSVNSIKRVGPLAIVDITIGKLNVGAEAEQRAIDQIVWTLTANDKSVRSVKFTSGGKALESFAGHVDASGTFKRETAYEVLAPVWINDPGRVDSASPWTMQNPVVISGTACTFEAAVAWEVLQRTAVIQSGSTTAAEGCPTRSLWKVKLENLAPGTYTFVAKNISEQDGSVDSQDSKTFMVAK